MVQFEQLTKVLWVWASVSSFAGVWAGAWGLAWVCGCGRRPCYVSRVKNVSRHFFKSLKSYKSLEVSLLKISF